MWGVIKMNITSDVKQWVAVGSAVLVSANAVTWPVNLKEMIPAWFNVPVFQAVTPLMIAGILGLVGAYWVAMSETK